MAWVRFGKYPMRTSDADSFLASPAVAPAAFGSSFFASEP